MRKGGRGGGLSAGNVEFDLHFTVEGCQRALVPGGYRNAMGVSRFWDPVEERRAGEMEIWQDRELYRKAWSIL